MALQSPTKKRCQPKVELAVARPLHCHEKDKQSGVSHPAWTETETEGGALKLTLDL